MRTVAILIPTLKKGGAEKQAALLARALQEKAHVIMIIPFSRSGMERELIDLSGLSETDIYAFKSCPKRQLYQTLKANHVDTLFCYLTWPDFWGVIIARMAGVRTIYQGIRNAALPFLKFQFERIGNRFASGAIINNYAGESVFGKRGIKNITVIPNCYPTVSEPTARSNKEQITVITVGRFVEQKDYPTALGIMAQIIQKYPHVRFKIIGHGELEDYIRNMIEAVGIVNNVDIMINPPDILSHLKNADIYLSTSLFEGTSNSIMEAMDASLPIVATNVGDNNQLVDNGKTGFLCNMRDKEGLFNALESLIIDADKRNQFGLAGNKLLHDKFGFEKFKQSYLKLL